MGGTGHSGAPPTTAPPAPGRARGDFDNLRSCAGAFRHESIDLIDDVKRHFDRIAGLGDFMGTDDSAKEFTEGYRKAVQNATAAINALAAILSTHAHGPKELLTPPIENPGPLPAPPGPDKAGIAERLDTMAATGQGMEWAVTIPTGNPADPLKSRRGG